MNIRELSDNLLKTYEEISHTFSTYQNNSGLSCPAGCGKCCLNPEIDATAVELIPFALKIYDQGLMDEWITRMDENTQNYCVLFTGDESGRGNCGQYDVRPGICRMFGVAGFRAKDGGKQLSVCRALKESFPEVARELRPSQDTPMMGEWYTRLTNLSGPNLQERLPINQAIKEALQLVSLDASYHDSRNT